MTEKMIVVAWLEEQEYYDAEIKEKKKAHPFAATWLLKGDDDDVRRAEKYAESLNRGCVLTFDLNEQDPLGKARAHVRRLAALEGAISHAMNG